MKERLENPMFLVIDMQNVYGKGQAWECRRFEEADQNIHVLPDQVTNEGSGMGVSETDIKKYAPGAVIEEGLSVNGSKVRESKKMLETWAKKLLG